MKPQLVTAPAAALLTASEVKAQVRVDFSDDDTLLTRLIGAVTSHLDGWSGVLGRCLIRQTWRQDFCNWGAVLRLPFPDVSAITSVTYVDANGEQQTVDSGSYQIAEDHVSSFVRFKNAFSWPSLSADVAAPVSVTFTAGYGTEASSVPDMIRHAAIMLVAAWYEDREGRGIVPDHVDRMLAPFRRVRI